MGWKRLQFPADNLLQNSLLLRKAWVSFDKEVKSFIVVAAVVVVVIVVIAAIVVVIVVIVVVVVAASDQSQLQKQFW